MKPPSRKRTVPQRFVPKEPELKRSAKGHAGWFGWKWNERHVLLAELKRQQRNTELDLVALQAKLPKRSIQQIESFIQFLKTVVGKRVTRLVNKFRLENQNDKVPIELWTEMAQKMAGSQEGAISSAFSQILVIAATEPCSLLNSYPPRLSMPQQLPPKLLTVPLKPMTRPPAETSSTCITPRGHGSTQLSSTQMPEGPNVNCQKGSLPFSEAKSSPSVVNLPCNSQPSLPIVAAAALPMNMKLKQGPISSSSPSPTSPLSSHVHVSQSSSKQGLTIPKSSQPAEQAASPSTRIFIQGQEHSSSSTIRGPISDQQTNPETLKHTDFYVDFENIYRFLSSVNKQGKMTPLSPMESAVVLDLLLSLPEQIPMLNCEELQRHFRQVYDHLSAPVKEPIQPISVSQEAPSHPAQTGGSTPGSSLQREISTTQEGGQLDQSLCTGSTVSDALSEKAVFCSSEMEMDPLPQTLTSQKGNGRGQETPANQSEIQDPTEQGADILAVGSPLQLQTAQQVTSKLHCNNIPINSQNIEQKSVFEKAGLCSLNPFIIPMKLLAQSQTPLSEG